MIKYIVALLSIFLGAYAQYFFKKGLSQFEIKGMSLLGILKSILFEWHILTGILFYAVSLVFWFYVLSQLPLSKAYPLVSIGYIISIFLGYYLLNEPLTTYKIIGVILICVGVVFISLSK